LRWTSDHSDGRAQFFQDLQNDPENLCRDLAFGVHWALQGEEDALERASKQSRQKRETFVQEFEEKLKCIAKLKEF